MQHPPNRSRRNFLKRSAMLALIESPFAATARSLGLPMQRSRLAYVGAITGRPGDGGNGEGIYLFQVDPKTGWLLERRLVAKAESPSWITLHPSGRYLYAANEITSYAGGSGSVTAYAIEAETGDLRLLNTVSSQGAGPAYVGLDASGRFAFVANYGGGGLAVLSIFSDGSLGQPAYVRRDAGSVGSPRATDAPAGSFAVSGHDAPHVHMTAADPANRFVLAIDLGQDRIYSFHLDAVTGKLSPNQAMPYMSLPSGDGPRHLAFHPSGHWLYTVQEESSTIACFAYHPDTGSMDHVQTLSTLPPGFMGTSFAAEVLISPDGKFLYASNRLHDSIAVFAIGTEGRLSYLAETFTHGDYPSQCRIDPSGAFFYACNRRSDCITVFSIERESGLLTFTGQYAAVGSPASITFLGSRI